ncbi:MAG TPA: tyrosine--tRNA ligase [Bacilli bacterium]|jgi:tyrosyl-tRNA synthetase|nr:tyrosine--tRNA ligase [Bacilli bacterium]NLT01755.1 tyrosine--tRNA ligase [Acholeplasmataceae bacterium]HNZ77268.1 tyrosine--tRNA ligase [Bacilli bacterium]HOD60611.1 tyrosine--tRNA ligase [Bacilli bacterium]HOH60996.1 tyrosine--tRNA ligase [Bacilli bacterium]
MNLLQDLKWRGLIYDVIDEEALDKRLQEGPISLYCGFDPTADSLHIGSLLPIVTLMRFHKAGHHVIVLTGGGTGLIGDPTGKKNERALNPVETVLAWGELFKSQFSRFIKFDNKTAFCVDNYDWLSKMSAIELWREYGRHFNINQMLAKESVKSRLDSGLTYLEFSYMIMQAIDFLKMHQDPILKCDMQIGGQDQWGNITAGFDLIRKVEGNEAKVYCLTIPLIVKSDGTKFGKTESGAVWLDEKKTTPYEMYQYFINTADADVIKYIKYYTFLSREEIEELEKKVLTEPHLREAQKVLSKEIVTMVHGAKAYEQAVHISEVLFSGKVKELNAEEIEEGFKGVPTSEINKPTNIVDCLVEIKAASSKREARTFLENGAISINGEIIKDMNFVISSEGAIENRFTIVRRGKKNYYLIRH